MSRAIVDVVQRIDPRPWTADEIAAVPQPSHVREWRRLRPGERSQLIWGVERSDPDKPVGTIVAGRDVAGVMHPHRPRWFTIDELKRLCGFPDGFVFLGTYDDQRERLGRSVPPVMMLQVAETIRDQIFGGMMRTRKAAARKTIEKPPYRVMTMEEIAKVRGTNGLTVVSTFSGCGGSCLGFEMAGYDVRWASEFVPAARAVYKLNHPGVILDDRDIRDVTPEDILKATGLKRGELDVLEGSPPCASFSTAGKREQHWGKVKKYSDRKQRTDDLFFEYVRILDGLRPKVFVAENVSGLVKGVAYGYFEMIIRRMRECGYRVKAKMLDAQWLGVPQMRKRMIFIGVREDLGIDPEYPDPLPYRYTIRDALPWISGLEWDSGGQWGKKRYDVDAEPVGTIMNGNGGGAQRRYLVEPARVIHDTGGKWGAGDVTERPVPTITCGTDASNSNHFKVVPKRRAKLVVKGSGWRNGEVESVDAPAPTVMAYGIGGVASHQMLLEEGSAADVSLKGTAIEREWIKLMPGEISERYFNLVRPHPDKPCPTVTAMGGQSRGVASVTHPEKPRKFYISELRRLCGFPDDFQLVGRYGQQWERLGRSVPPVMMCAVASALRDKVFRR